MNTHIECSCITLGLATSVTLICQKVLSSRSRRNAPNQYHHRRGGLSSYVIPSLVTATLIQVIAKAALG